MTYYRLMTLLPALPDKPVAPPIPLSAMTEHLTVSLKQSHLPAAEALLGILDCRNLEAMLQKWDLFDPRGLLGRDALEQRTDLPEYMEQFLLLHDSGTIQGPYPYDELWRGYYRHVVETAGRVGSTFLLEWATWEISLLNELVRRRADQLGLEAESRLMDPPHGEGNHGELMVRLSEAPDPQTRQLLLDSARLEAIEGLGPSDPFCLDAVLSYLAAMLVLDGWALPENPKPQALLENLEQGDNA